MFDALIQRIEELKATKPHVVVAISGFGGSGKTELANKLRDRFHIDDKQIIRLDNLFAKQPYGDGVFDEYDWPLINEILRDVRDGKRLCYVGRGFHGEEVRCDEPLPSVVIIEGVRLLRPEAMHYVDLPIWIDCPEELATQRGKARDKDGGADEAHIRRWDTEWVPRDQEYFDTYHPERLATFLYKDSS